MTRALVTLVVSLVVALAQGRTPIDTPPAPSLVGDWTQFGWDVARSNASPDDTGITAANVATLVRQRVVLEDGVDASPIFLGGVTVNGATHDTLFMTTSYGKTIAIDAANGVVLWTYTPPAYSTWFGSRQITAATPVADPTRQFIYAASPDGRIQQLAVADGHAAWSTAITLLPQREKIASSLNYFNGRVIATTGGYVGDAPPYQGHVALLDAATGSLLHVWNSLCSDRAGLLDPSSCPESGSAIWGRAGAVVDAATGNIFVATGNGRWDGRTYWGDATLELDPDATRLIGSYTPTNTASLDQLDLDIGSTSPVLVGGDFLAQGGKDHLIRLLSVQQMAAALVGRELQTVATPSGSDLFTAPAVWRNGAATLVITADAGATAAWSLVSGLLQQQWRAPNGGTSPVVAGGLVFAHDPSGGLRVYDAASGAAVTRLDCGGGHWDSPIVVPGLIAMPESTTPGNPGALNIWRLPGARRITRRR